MRMKHWVGLALCGLGLIGCGAKAAEQPAAQTPAQAAVSEPGTARWAGSRVSLATPPNMKRPTRLAYFKLEEPLIVIAIAEMTAPDGKAAEMMEGARNGAKLVDEKAATRGTARGFVGHGTTDQNGLERQVLGLEQAGAVAIVVAQYQKEAEATVERILDSVRLDASAKLDPLALHGISIGDPAGFEVWNVTSQPIIMADLGARPPVPDSVAKFALLSMPYPKPDFSDEELGQMLGSVIGKKQPDMQKAKMTTSEIAGTPAFVVTAPGQEDGKPIGIFAFILRRPDSAFLGFGDVALSKLEATLPRYERLVKSLRLDDGVFSQ